MAIQTKLAQLLNGLVQNITLTADELQVGSIRLDVATAGGTELTKTILDSLIANSHASGSDNQTITAGAGLTGGGSGASVTLNIGQGDGITVSADEIAVTADVLRDADKGVAGGVASLDGGGKIPSSQLPAIAITEVFTAADITARDALTIGSGAGEVQEGDVVIVADASADVNITSGAASYIYDGSAYLLLKAGDEVLSVNGETGAVTLDSADLDHTQADTGDWTVADGSTIKAHLDELADRLVTVEADNSSDSITKTMTAGEALSANVTYVLRYAVSGETDGRVYKVGATAALGHAVAVYRPTAAISAGDPITATLLGEVISSVAFSAAADEGKPVFATTAGLLTLTAPSSGAVIQVGSVALIGAAGTAKILVQAPRLVGVA